jgi:type I restriction enzyme S subunit
MREMKDSGVEWIGEIPKNWKVERLRYIIKDYKSGPFGSALKMDGLLPDGNILIYSPEHITLHSSDSDKNLYLPDEREEEMSQFIVKENDILFPIVGSLGKAMIITADMPKGIINQRVAKFQIDNTIVDQDYFMWLFAKSNFYQPYIDLSCRGSFIVNLTKAIINDMPCVIQPLAIQKKISTYLDIKCSKIDEIIEKQQAIIEKLKEYKLSIITEAVTSGINPDVEMKDSGSVWFGSIPTNWEMKRLKYVFHIQKDIAGEEGHTVLSITQKGIIPKDFSNNEGQFANSYANYQLVHKGDFAMNHMDLLTGWVDISKYEGVTSPDYRVFVLNDKNGMCPEYYLYMMQMCYSARIFYGLGQGVSGMGRWRLQADKFLNFHIPIPPYDEQKIIADYITDKVNHIEVEIDKRNKLVEKYQEYKKSLIYEVVTGKKEV